VLQLAAAPAPPTGEALAELIADGVARSTDLTPFDPMRLQPLDRRYYCTQADQRASALANPTPPKSRKLLVFHGKRDALTRQAEVCRVDRNRPGDKIAIRRATRLTTVTPVKRFCNAASTFQQQM
jgi:hypothetical protein